MRDRAPQWQRSMLFSFAGIDANLYESTWQACNGESRRDVMLRKQRLIHAAAYKQVVVITRRGVLAAALKALIGVPADRSPFMLYNGSISMLEWDTQIKLMTLNQIDHLRAAGCALATRTGDLA